jgi:hypothetical protein
MWVVLGRVLYALGARRAEGKWIGLMQAGNFLITKGVMFRNTRQEYERGNDAEGKDWADAENFLDRLVRGF